jgi:uncharacterized protein YggT (Ycf19 family)
MSAEAPVAAKPVMPSLAVARFIQLLLHGISVLLLVRVLLIVLGANIDQPLTAALISFTQPFTAPFEDIIAQPTDASGIVPIDVGALIGIVALQLVRLLVRTVGRRVAELP